MFLSQHQESNSGKMYLHLDECLHTNSLINALFFIIIKFEFSASLNLLQNVNDILDYMN